MTNVILDELRLAVGADGLITEQNQLQTYECDGLTNFSVVPSAVSLPRTARAGAGRSAGLCEASDSVRQ